LITILAAPAISRPAASSEEPASAPWLADRGPGTWTSIFGMYVRRGELLAMPFFEAYFDDDTEYKPAELGYGLEQDFRGRFRATESQIFLAYGVSERIAVELEGAPYATARLDKAADDPSSQPARLEQSGLGDWQMEMNWRALKETATRPEVFALLEVDPPSNTRKALIGTPDWEAKFGVGAIRGLSWGTVAARVCALYSGEDGSVESGEYAFEYLKRVSPAWSLYGGVEGEQDEVELIGEAQWHFRPNATLRLNLARGLSSKAVDWGPDVGVMFHFPKR
jgi:hypothetical protein